MQIRLFILASTKWNWNGLLRLCQLFELFSFSYKNLQALLKTCVRCFLRSIVLFRLTAIWYFAYQVNQFSNLYTFLNSLLLFDRFRCRIWIKVESSQRLRTLMPFLFILLHLIIKLWRLLENIILKLLRISFFDHKRTLIFPNVGAIFNQLLGHIEISINI